MMDISYEDGQLLLRALRGHATRMLKIAEAESMLGKHDMANVAVDESKMASALADKIERSGVRIS